jgi:hypothetical protein
MILTLDAKRRLTLPASLVPVLKACPVKMDDPPPRRSEFPKRLKL